MLGEAKAEETNPCAGLARFYVLRAYTEGIQNRVVPPTMPLAFCDLLIWFERIFSRRGDELMFFVFWQRSRFLDLVVSAVGKQ